MKNRKNNQSLNFGAKNVKEKIKKVLAFFGKTMYNINCCGMIAVKREVAAYVAGFPWSECQVRKLTTSHCTKFNNHLGMGRVCKYTMTHTEMCTVAACRTAI